VDASCIWRWVQAYAPELNKRCRPHLKRTNKSYRIDEIYINVKGEDKYLNRAPDSTGQTIDFLLTANAIPPQPNAFSAGADVAGYRDRERSAESLTELRTYPPCRHFCEGGRLPYSVRKSPA
jgi:hypothetical protein